MSTFDPKSVRLIASIKTPGILFGIALDEDRRTLYGAGMDGGLYSLDLSNPRALAVKKGELHENYVSSLVLRGDTLISTGYDRKIVWSDPATGKIIRSVSGHDGWIRKLVLTPDGSRFATIGDDMRLIMWDAERGQQLAVMKGHEARVPEGYLSALYGLAISPDGRYAASGDRAGSVCIWDLTRCERVANFRATDFYTFDPVKRARAMGGIRGLAFSADALRLAISGIGAVTNVDGFVGPCRMELWDWKAGKRIAFGQDKHQAILNQVAFEPIGSWVTAVGGGDGGGAIVFWDSSGATPQAVKAKGHLQAFTMDAARTRLYAVGHSGFQVWASGAA
jgi:WD40 repeat protein